MNYTLITGASAGIGKDLAFQLAKENHNLILVARRIEELNSITQELSQRFSVDVIPIQLDLTHPDSTVLLFEKIKQQELRINYFINNAGFGLAGSFKTNSLERETSLIELNIISLLSLSKAYINYLGSKKGKLIQLASTAAFFPGPNMAVYYASKAFVVSFSKAIRTELKSTSCSVAVVCPGPTTSEFQQVAGFKQKEVKGLVMTSEQVAQYISKKMITNTFLIIPGFFNKLSVYTSFITPNWLSDRIIGRIHSK